MDETRSAGLQSADAIRSVRAHAGAPRKIVRSASDPANLCKTRNTDKFGRRMGCARRCGELGKLLHARIVGRLCQTPALALAFHKHALQNSPVLPRSCDSRC